MGKIDTRESYLIKGCTEHEKETFKLLMFVIFCSVLFGVIGPCMSRYSKKEGIRRDLEIINGHFSGVIMSVDSVGSISKKKAGIRFHI